MVFSPTPFWISYIHYYVFLATFFVYVIWSLASNYLYSWPWSLSMINRRKDESFTIFNTNNFHNIWAQHMQCMANMDFAHGIVAVQSSRQITPPWSCLFWSSVAPTIYIPICTQWSWFPYVIVVDHNICWLYWVELSSTPKVIWMLQVNWTHRSL